MTTATFRTAVELGGATATGLVVPPEVVDALAAGVAAGDEVEVSLTLDDEPRTVTVPDDLAGPLADDPAAREFFDGLAHTHRKEWVRWIEDAKRPETRATRVAATLTALREGRRTR